MILVRRSSSITSLLCSLTVLVFLMVLRTGPQSIINTFNSAPTKASVAKPETRAEYEARERKRFLGGVVGLTLFLGFAGYGIYRWFKETDEVLSRSNTRDPFGDGINYPVR